MVIQQLEVAGDDKKQVVEIMGNAPGELPYGLHLLGLRQPPFALTQGLLDMRPIAQVMDDTGEIPLAMGSELADR
jgi:hypothetical protein